MSVRLFCNIFQHKIVNQIANLSRHLVKDIDIRIKLIFLGKLSL